MKCFLLSFLIGILTPAFLSGQCPERKALWDRILFLRDSSVQSLDQQLQELLPYLQQMKNCPYANDSTHALLLQRLGALYFLQSDYVTGIRYTRESIGIIYQQLGKPSVNPRHLIKSYNNLRICYDSLKQQNLKLQAIDSCIAVSLRLHTGYEYALPLLYERILNLIESGDYYRCIQYALIAETLARNYGYSIDNRLSFITWRINALILLKRYQEADELAASKIDECRKAGSTASLGALYALRGTAVQESGDLNKALDLYQKAFYFDARINNRPGCAGTLNNTGYLLYFKQLKQFNNALHYYQRALEYAGPGESLNIFDNIANVYVAKKQFDSAFYFFQKAFDQIRPGGNERDLLLHTGTYMNSAITEYISNLVLDKADAYLARYRDLQEEDKLNDAIRTYKIIDQFFDKIKLSQIEIQSKLFWRKHIQRLYENAIEACFLRGNIPDALYFFEKKQGCSTERSDQ